MSFDNESLPENLEVMGVPLPAVRFATKFDTPGQSIAGAFVHYHPTYGAQTYVDRKPCGVLMLKRPDGGIVKLALDKGQLATAVDNALALAPSVLDPAQAPYLIVRVTYKGDAKGYKEFECKIGVSRNREAHEAVFGANQ